ncbi:uncharacterized protein [Pithys albifrons albifrons]|uniref:uncharacterized protein n=1 Tax=Pithys albifrons albifrons TaxID=3385563 RepID=UPI003A5D1BAB
MVSPAAPASCRPPRAGGRLLRARTQARWHRLLRVRGGGTRWPRSGCGALPVGGGASPSGRCGGRLGREGLRSLPGPRSLSPRRRSPGPGLFLGASRRRKRTESRRDHGEVSTAGERRGGPRFAADAMLLGALRSDAGLIDFPSHGGCQRDGARIESVQRQARTSFLCPGRRHEQGENQEHPLEGTRGGEEERGKGRSSSDSLMPPPVVSPTPTGSGPRSRQRESGGSLPRGLGSSVVPSPPFLPTLPPLRPHSPCL